MQTKQLQLVTFNQAKRLKELGFDWECQGLYFSDDKLLSEDYGLFNHNSTEKDDEWTCEVFSAPSVALALKWFRDEKKIIGFPYYDADDYTYYFNRNGVCCDLYGFETYETAESALLDELLTILEKDTAQ